MPTIIKTEWTVDSSMDIVADSSIDVVTAWPVGSSIDILAKIQVNEAEWKDKL
jgi:hypothetical protein